ncbi:hypothetical protein ACQPZJ_27150 [Actinoplanes sp. CA-054009]
MIETSTWDPPPRKPGLSKAYIGGALALVTTAVVAAGAVWGVKGAIEARYGKDFDACGALDTGVLAEHLGVPAPREEAGPVSRVCDYGIVEDGRRRAGGQLTVSYHGTAFMAWLEWDSAMREAGPGVIEVPGLGRHAAVASERDEVLGEPVCVVQLQVLDSNALLFHTLIVPEDLKSRPCDDQAGLRAAVIDSMRVS